MSDPYNTDIHELKQQKLRWRRLVFALISGSLVLVLLCGAINFTFFAAGIAFGNVWPFPQRTDDPAPNMIASYLVNEMPKSEPVVYDTPLYSNAFNGRTLPGWQTFADGWDVVNGVYYGTNTRTDTRTAALYSDGYGWQDYVVEADVTALAAPDASSVQLLFRSQDDSAAGRCQLSAGATGKRQLELVTPEGQRLASSFHYTTGEAYRLRATAVGRTVTCEIVGQPGTKLTGYTNVRQGTVGFQNQYVTGAFDNLEVSLP